MRIVGRHILEESCRRYPNTRRWVENWHADVSCVVWTSPAELKRTYAAASFLAGNVVIFNVNGNSFRMEVTVAYATGVVAVNWMGSHAGYDARNKRRGRRR
jgi:mRNA interferase HigB